MVRKYTIFSAVVVCAGVTLADYFSPIIGASICCIVSIVVSRKYLSDWLIGLSQRLEKFPVRYTRRRRKRIITIASGYLLPWVEKSFLLFRLPKEASKLADHGNESFSEGLDVSTDNDQNFHESSNSRFCGMQPMPPEEVKSFVHHISKDYIQSWYKDLSQNDEFVGDLNYILEDVFIALCDRFSRLNSNQLFNRILMISFNHFLFMKESVANQNAGQGIKNMNFKIIHPAMRDEKADYIYLMGVCEILLDIVGPSDLLQCAAIRSFLIDILTKNLLAPLLQLLTDPQWVFSMIIYLITDSDADRIYDDILQNDFLVPDNIPCANIFSRMFDLTSENPINKLLTEDQSDSVSKATRPKTLSAVQRTADPKPFSSVMPHISIDQTQVPAAESRGSLSNTKSISLDSLYEVCLETQLPKLKLDATHCSLQFEQSINISPISLGEDIAGLSSGDSSCSPINVPQFSLFPAKGLTVERTSSSGNFDLLPSPIRNCLPKKLSFREKIRPSRSLDFIHGSASLPANMRFASSVFQKFPGAEGQGAKDQLDSKSKSPSVDVEEAEEVTEFENVNPFHKLCIKGVREQKDPKQKVYILYCVEVEYVEVVTVLGEQQRIMRTGSADRRFKEFIALQSKLEHPRYKKHIKGIIGPTKFLTLHISPSDKKNIEKRRTFLQKYLQELCSRDAIFKNHEFQLFLGIQGDPRLEFVQNASHLPLSGLFGLGKMMQPVKEVITKLTMPSQFLDNGNGELFHGISQEKSPTQTKSLLPSFGKSKQDAKLPPLIFNYRKMSNVEQDAYNFLDRFDVLSSSPEESRSSSPYSGLAGPLQTFEQCSIVPRWQTIASNLQLTPCGQRAQGDGCDSPERKNPELKQYSPKFNNLQECLNNEIPHANTLLDTIACLLLPNNALSDDNMMVVLKVVLGDLLQCWLHKNLKERTSRENCVFYLHLLHTKLWPIQPVPSKPVVSVEQYKAALFAILRDSFPKIARYLLGEKELLDNLKFILDCIQDYLHNRNLMYQIIDVVMEMLCTQELQDCSP